jgi:hypothetical protein
MNLKTTTSHTVTFAVRAFINTEGGMDEDEFGPYVADLPGAIHLLELARIKDPRTPWVIVADVQTSVS